MIVASHEVLSFAIGVLSGFLPCCFVCYPGLFSYFQTEGQKPSRIRAGAYCLVFAAGALLVAGILTVAFLLIAPEIRSIIDNAQHLVNDTAFVVLSIIGVSYLLGRGFSLPIPRLGFPAGLINGRGYRSAYLYGIFIGGPGQAHCTISLVIPLVFLFFTSLTPVAIVTYFVLYCLGRTIPLVVIGLMLQDAQIRFFKTVSRNSQTLNRLIGIIFVIGGLVLFFTI
jgi:cytochrome c biogenesis protein CcdA